MTMAFNVMHPMKPKSEKTMRVFWAITIITALGTAAGSVISPVEVRFLQTLTSDTSLIGARFSFTAFLAGLFAMVIGRMSAHRGKREFMVSGAALAVIYPLFYASASNIFQYMGAGVVSAFSGAALGPLLASHLQDSLAKSKSRGKYIGISYAVCAISGSIGAFIGGIAADTYGLNAAYYAMSAIAALSAALTILFAFGRENAVNVQREKNHESGYKEIEKEIQSRAKKHDLPFSLKYILISIPARNLPRFSAE